MTEIAVQMVAVEELTPNPYNKRRAVSEARMKELADSVGVHGVLSPLIVRPHESGLEIVAGERRWKAARRAGLEAVPAIVRQLSDTEAREVCILENLQREDLNMIEEAESFQDLVGLGMAVHEIARKLGKEENFVYTRMNLLELDCDAREALIEGNITKNTALALLRMDEEYRAPALDRVAPERANGRAMPEAEALEVLREEFLEPAKRRRRWRELQRQVETEHPDARWLDYDEALEAAGWESGLAFASRAPEPALLDPEWRASHSGEVPTWGELAGRYGGTVQIGVRSGDGLEVALMVDSEPLISADRAAAVSEGRRSMFGPEPGERDEAQSEDEHREEQLRVQEARRRWAQQREACEAEVRALQESIMGGELPATRERALAAWCVEWLTEHFAGCFECLPGGPDAGPERVEWAAGRAGQDVARRGEEGGIAALGRLLAADLVGSMAEWHLEQEAVSDLQEWCVRLRLPRRLYPTLMGHHGD